MSDSEQDASVLGKRARNGPGTDLVENVDMNPPSVSQDDDESDDDVGPMPMPEGTPVGAGTKKKRKGPFLLGRRNMQPCKVVLKPNLPSFAFL
jgi:peptidylprolyl isomerase domain and WD repeat-containing protein 1